MTEEQYQKVISLNKRLTELEEVYSLISDEDTHLSYYQPSFFGTRAYLCAFEKLTPIKDILKRYEDTIRFEVKTEIESIKNQISEI